MSRRHDGRSRRRGIEAPHLGISDIHLTRVVAVFASTGAGIVHTLVTDDHWKEWRLSGLFFAAVAVTQFGWAMAAAVRDGRALMGIGVAANAGVLLLWGVSRVTGLPLGPHAGVPEQVSAADLLTVALELVVCAMAGWSLRRPAAWSRSLPRSAVAVCAAWLLVAAFTVPAIGDAADGHSHGTDPGHTGDEHDGHPHTPGDGVHPTDGAGGGTHGHHPTAPSGSPSPRKTPAHGGPGHSHANHPH